MKKLLCLASFPLLFALSARPARAQDAVQDAAKLIQPSPPAAAAPAPVRNRDVLDLIAAGLAPEIIVAKIRAAGGDFDTSPAALKSLREAGATDAIVLAVVESTRGGASVPAAREKKIVPLKLPAGVRVELESAYRINSQEVRKGDLLTFRVVNPVKVDGVTVIEPGAVATARVTKATRGGHFGRAGRLAWVMYEVTAVDGTRIAIDTQGRRVGDSKGAKVATQIAITAAVLPLIAPVALLHGFKRGENAYLPEGARFDSFVSADAMVNAAVDREE